MHRGTRSEWPGQLRRCRALLPAYAHCAAAAPLVMLLICCGSRCDTPMSSGRLFYTADSPTVDSLRPATDQGSSARQPADASVRVKVPSLGLMGDRCLEDPINVPVDPRKFAAIWSYSEDSISFNTPNIGPIEGCMLDVSGLYYANGTVRALLSCQSVVFRRPPRIASRKRLCSHDIATFGRRAAAGVRGGSQV
jgi:hypothetical protein